MSYYHPSENKIALNDLKRSFDLILTGHLHEAESLQEVCPNHKSITFCSPAIYSSYENIGYNIYEIDLSLRQITAKFRQYIRQRDTFAQDVRHADDGQMKFDLPTRDITIFNSAMVCQKISNSNTTLEKTIEKELSLYQQTDKPIFVNPAIRGVAAHHGAMVSSVLSGNIVDLAKSSCVIYGGSQSGKTVLLQTIAAKCNRASIDQRKLKDCAVYIDLNRKRVSATELESMVESAKQSSSLPQELDGLVICVDNLQERDQHVHDQAL